MYANPSTCSNTADTIALTMNHALAQVSFYVYKNNYSGSGSFTKFQIADTTGAVTPFIKTTGTDLVMNFKTGAITGGATDTLTRTLATPDTLSTVIPSTVPADLRAQVNATTLTIPATSTIGAGGIKFTVTIDGVDYTTSNTEGITWAAGKQYIYSIKLEGTILAISDPTVTDWTPAIAVGSTIN